MRTFILLILSGCTSSAWPDHVDERWSQAFFGADGSEIVVFNFGGAVDELRVEVDMLNDARTPSAP